MHVTYANAHTQTPNLFVKPESEHHNKEVKTGRMCAREEKKGEKLGD